MPHHRRPLRHHQPQARTQLGDHQSRATEVKFENKTYQDGIAIVRLQINLVEIEASREINFMKMDEIPIEVTIKACLNISFDLVNVCLHTHTNVVKLRTYILT